MKNSLTAILPALGLLALSGCAGTGAIATSEDDGVYYSSKDRTTAVARPAAQTYNQPYASGSSAPATPAPATTDEATNPDYNGSASNSSAGNDQYYDDSNAGYSTNKVYPNGVPSYDYYTPGITNYAPVAYAPYTVIAPPPYLYSPYGYSTVWADPFYNPYYSPYYGYGSGVSISIGFGRPWGYGGFGYGGFGYGGYGYGSPWGYGGYNPYFYGGPFYSGFYGGGGYYGANYYGGGYYGSGYRDVIYTGGGSYGGGRRTVLVGPRGGRGGDVTGRRTASTPSTGTTVVTPSGGRGTTGGRPAGSSVPTGGAMQPAGTSSGYITETVSGRGRSAGGHASMNNVPAGTQQLTESGNVRPVPTGGGRADANTNGRPTYVDGMNSQPIDAGNGRNNRAANQPQVTQPQVSQPRVSMPQSEPQRQRRGFFGGGDTNYSQRAEQPQQRTESRSRSYEQPTYSPPSRSYSQPSGGGGGGSFGGSGGGGGGGRRGR